MYYNIMSIEHAIVILTKNFILFISNIVWTYKFGEIRQSQRSYYYFFPIYILLL